MTTDRHRTEVYRMDETQELLRAVISRLEEMGAELKGLRAEVKEFRADTNERLEKVEERLDYLAANGWNMTRKFTS